MLSTLEYKLSHYTHPVIKTKNRGLRYQSPFHGHAVLKMKIFSSMPQMYTQNNILNTNVHTENVA